MLSFNGKNVNGMVTNHSWESFNQMRRYQRVLKKENLRIIGNKIGGDFGGSVSLRAISEGFCQSNAQVNAKKGGKTRKNDKK